MFSTFKQHSSEYSHRWGYPGLRGGIRGGRGAGYRGR